MRQVQHMNTPDSPPRRGRGRPRVENPLSAAERARRYRERKREAAASPGKPAKARPPGVAAGTEVSRLKEELRAHRERAAQWEWEASRLGQEVADLRSLLDMFIDARLKRKPIPGDVFRNICASYLKK